MKNTIRVCFAVVALTLGACDAAEDIDEASDCETICDEYADCWDDGYDTEACQERCTERADDMSSRDQEEDCSNCIDGSCAEDAFECSIECAGIIVPQ